MPRHTRKSWQTRDFALLGAMMGLGVWLNRQPLMDMIGIGLRDQEQSHIFLAPIVALWLFWLRRSRLRSVRRQPSLWGVAIATLGWLTSWWGFTAGVQVAWHAGAILTLMGILLSFTGPVPLRLFSPVFLVLVFCLPVPGELRHRMAYPLQEITTGVAQATLEFVGVSSVKSGNMLVINGEQVAVGEACNGMRMVFALTLVVFAFAFGTPLRPSTRLVLVALSPLVAIGCNVIRLVPTSLIFGYGELETAQLFHDVAGWVMLPLALVILACVLRMIRWLEFPVVHYRLANQ